MQRTTRSIPAIFLYLRIWILIQTRAVYLLGRKNRARAKPNPWARAAPCVRRVSTQLCFCGTRTCSAAKQSSPTPVGRHKFHGTAPTYLPVSKIEILHPEFPPTPRKHSDARPVASREAALSLHAVGGWALPVRQPDHMSKRNVHRKVDALWQGFLKWCYFLSSNCFLKLPKPLRINGTGAQCSARDFNGPWFFRIIIFPHWY